MARHSGAFLNTGKDGNEEFDAIVSDVHVLLEQALTEKSSEKYRAGLDIFFVRLRELAGRDFGICCLCGDRLIRSCGRTTPTIIEEWRWALIAPIVCSRKLPGFSHHIVEYSRERTVNIVREGWPRAFVKLFARKSLDWAYEREQRFISHVGPGCRRFKEGALRTIVLGARFRENHSEQCFGLSCARFVCVNNR